MTYRGRMGRWKGGSGGRDIYIYGGLPGSSAVKKSPTVQKTQETWVQSLGQEDSPGEGNGNPLQYSCLENPMHRGAWQATVHKVAKSWTRLSHTHTQMWLICDVTRQKQVHHVKHPLIKNKKKKKNMEKLLVGTSNLKLRDVSLSLLNGLLPVDPRQDL